MKIIKGIGNGIVILSTPYKKDIGVMDFLEFVNAQQKARTHEI